MIGLTQFLSDKEEFVVSSEDPWSGISLDNHAPR